MELLVFGLNHQTAPLEVRERWSFSHDESAIALGRLKNQSSRSEHLILSTCNRTEFYSHVPRDVSLIQDDVAALEQCRRLAEFYVGNQTAEMLDEFEVQHFYLYRQREAVEHLFRVAGGLDSMIVGESEILHQIKVAFEVAREEQSAGKMFERLFPEALKVGKRVRTQTDISKGCITPGQAALKLAEETLDGLAGARALLIGSGKVATIAARSLMESGFKEFTVINRTPERARELLAKICPLELEHRGHALEWNELTTGVESADLVISSTASSLPILSVEDLVKVQIHRRGAPLTIIDLAIPRDVEPGAADIDGIRLFNIDDLNRVVHENIEKRHGHIAQAEEIVQERLTIFFGQLNYLQIDPVIKHLIKRFEDIRLGELQASLDRFPPELHAAVDEVTRRLVNKMVNFPIERLKAVRNMEGLGHAEISFLKRLFLSDP